MQLWLHLEVLPQVQIEQTLSILLIHLIMLYFFELTHHQ